MNLIKNNPSLNTYQDWVAYLEEAAEILIAENRVMDAVEYLKECQHWAVKRGDGVCLTDGGAYNLMITLMDHCRQSQIKQVDYLMQEFFLPMHPKWFFKKGLKSRYYQMFHRGF